MSAVTKLIQIVLVHPVVMTDLMEHGRPNLVDQLGFRFADDPAPHFRTHTNA